VASTGLQHDAEQDFREMRGRTYVLTLLQSLIRRRELVSIMLPGSDARYTSTVLSVDSHNNTLLLDDLFPREGHEQLQQLGEAQLFAHMGSGAMEFSARLEGMEEADGLSYFRLHLPETVNYMQRREGHRIVVSKLEIPAEVYDQRGASHPARVYDISASGIGFLVSKSSDFPLDTITPCVLHFPAESSLSCKVEFCDRRSASANIDIIGGIFVGLDAQKEHILHRCTADLERRLLRMRREPVVPPK
jgi:c-di-GMP-binding flagellar brake protein YcgR